MQKIAQPRKKVQAPFAPSQYQRAMSLLSHASLESKLQSALPICCLWLTPSPFTTARLTFPWRRTGLRFARPCARLTGRELRWRPSQRSPLRL